jgi:hypothetical protein
MIQKVATPDIPGFTQYATVRVGWVGAGPTCAYIKSCTTRAHHVIIHQVVQMFSPVDLHDVMTNQMELQ